MAEPQAPAAPTVETPVGQAISHEDARGSLVIADVVVEKIAAASALEIDEVVRYRSQVGTLLGSGAGRSLLGSDLPRASVDTVGTARKITIEIAVQWPCGVVDVASGVRSRVSEAVERCLGDRPVQVNVTVGRVVPRAQLQRQKQGIIDLPDAQPADEPERDETETAKSGEEL